MQKRLRQSAGFRQPVLLIYYYMVWDLTQLCTIPHSKKITGTRHASVILHHDKNLKNEKKNIFFFNLIRIVNFILA
jgi:hypothetical protein